MSIAQGIGPTGKAAAYVVPDTELAVGSTLGGPKVTAIIKANGSIERVYDVDAGATVFGTFILRHYDGRSGMYLGQSAPGTFTIHPEHQEHRYSLSNAVAVHETIVVLSGHPGPRGMVDPPGVYQIVELTNESDESVELITYAYAVLRGNTEHDVEAVYDKRLHAIIAWNTSAPKQARIVGCSQPPESWEVTLDHAGAVAESCPGPLSCTIAAASDEPLGVLQHRHVLEPGEHTRFFYLLSLGAGRRAAARNYRSCPDADMALERTKAYYGEMLDRAVVLTPDEQVNRGVVWAKANMLRVMTKAQTGWCFTNDPTRSNNSVARDTAWFAFGCDYLRPEFVKESLLQYVHLQEKSGMIVEYYDIRTGKTADYGLNINDCTPLLIMALWHHYNATGDEDFLRDVYPAALKAARYIISQRNDEGLVWCTATGVSDWGIVGWRNVIPNYRLSGATTEVNSECFAALETISAMARELGRHEESQEMAFAACELQSAINMHLYNHQNGLYYLNIDLEGHARSDITSDLVFPAIFGVASEHTSAAIISRLSNQDFWTEGGIRTSPRDAPMYTPDGGWGLLGGVWVGVSFWYAFAAAKHAPALMAHALSTSFRNYSTDPRRNNTVPGQFSEWLHGETLVNQGMMLSPWFPPRYLWASLEGMAGLSLSNGSVSVTPHLAPDWKWMAVRNLPIRNESLTWFAVCTPELHVHGNIRSQGNSSHHHIYDEDVSSSVHTAGDAVCAVALRQGWNLAVFVGNTSDRTETTSINVTATLEGRYRLCSFDSLLNEWIETDDLLSPEDLNRGITVHLERKGFCLLRLTQES